MRLRPLPQPLLTHHHMHRKPIVIPSRQHAPGPRTDDLAVEGTGEVFFQGKRREFRVTRQEVLHHRFVLFRL